MACRNTESLADHNAKNPDRPAAPFAIVNRSFTAPTHGSSTISDVRQIQGAVGDLPRCAVPEVNDAIAFYGGIVAAWTSSTTGMPIPPSKKGTDGLIAVPPPALAACWSALAFCAHSGNREIVRKVRLFAVGARSRPAARWLGGPGMALTMAYIGRLHRTRTKPAASR